MAHDDLIQAVREFARQNIEATETLLRKVAVFAAPNPQDPTIPKWCTCTRCAPMSTDDENVCCKRPGCVTFTEAFSELCLARSVLICNMANRGEGISEEEITLERLRHAAYKIYTTERFFDLGCGNRLPLPSCAVLAIRRKYPDPNGQYTGFIPGSGNFPG